MVKSSGKQSPEQLLGDVMFIKKGISIPPEKFNMKILESGPAQKCSDCDRELPMKSSENGMITCVCGQINEISLEKTNGK